MGKRPYKMTLHSDPDKLPWYGKKLAGQVLFVGGTHYFDTGYRFYIAADHKFESGYNLWFDDRHIEFMRYIDDNNQLAIADCACKADSWYYGPHHEEWCGGRTPF